MVKYRYILLTKAICVGIAHFSLKKKDKRDLFKFPQFPSINFATQQWQGHQLPAWLFTQALEDENFVSPTSQFSIETALDGQPWQSSTTPNAEMVPLALVIDSHIYKYGILAEDVDAQIEWLKSKSIPIYICIEQAGHKLFIDCQIDEIELTETLNHLATFDVETDYEEMATQVSLAQDKSVILNEDKAIQLYACLHQKMHYRLDKITLASEETQTTICGKSSYEVSFPYVFKTLNETLIKNNQAEILCEENLTSEDTEMFKNICKTSSCELLWWLKRHTHLINASVADKVYQRYPSQRHITMPLIYQ